MIIERANFQDIPFILDLVDEAHARSRYSDVPFLPDDAYRVARQCLYAPEKPAIGQPIAFVARTKNGVDGVLIGSMSRLYEVLPVAIAQDFLFYVRAPQAAEGLLTAFRDWAFSRDGRVIVRLMMSDAIVDPALSGRWLSRQGYRLMAFGFEVEKAK